MAPTFTTTVRSVSRCGNDVVLVALEIPEDYSYRAGQWFRLTLPTPEGPQTRTLSHAAAPSDGVIETATRLSPSAFKLALAALVTGDRVEVSAAGGRMRLPAGDPRLGFLAGGVGITPIRSLVRDAIATERTFSDAVLIYGNRDETCVPFGEEFEAVNEAGLEIVHVLESPTEIGWPGDRGLITSELVRRHAPPEGRVYLVSGPPVMVAAMERVLDELEVPAQRRVVESFGPSRPAVQQM